MMILDIHVCYMMTSAVATFDLDKKKFIRGIFGVLHGPKALNTVAVNYVHVCLSWLPRVSCISLVHLLCTILEIIVTCTQAAICW